MPVTDTIEKQSDSLIELLTAQCADLEKLLALARQETVATRSGDFEGVLEVVSERALLGARLETFQRRITELRQRLGGAGEPLWQGEVAVRMSEVVRRILAHDSQTRLLLTAARHDSAAEINRLEQVQRGSNAYLGEKPKGLAYDQKF